jgi:hypothetical protein
LLAVAGKYAVVYGLTNWEVFYPVNVDDNTSDVITLRSLVGKCFHPHGSNVIRTFHEA